MQTMSRKVALINVRYPDMPPTNVITKLLGCDVGKDNITSSVTGEQGGKILCCYLFHMYENQPDETPFLEKGILFWLELQLKRYAICAPAQKSCIEQAIRFLPKLIKEVAKARPAAAPAPTFDLDDDDDAVSSVQAPNFGTSGDRRESVSELPLGARDALRCPEMPGDARRCVEMRRDAPGRSRCPGMLRIGWDGCLSDYFYSILFKHTRTLPMDLHVFSCQRNPRGRVPSVR